MPIIVANILFGVIFLAVYLIGYKMGFEASKGNDITDVINPVKAIQSVVEANETKKQNELYVTGLDNILRYDGNPQKQEE